MSRRFVVEMRNDVSAFVRVKVSDETLQRIADEREVDVADVTIEMLDDVIRDAAHDYSPGSLCIHCSGSGMGSTFNMDLTSDWQISDDYWRPSDGTQKPISIEEVTEPSSRSESYGEV